MAIVLGLLLGWFFSESGPHLLWIDRDYTKLVNDVRMGSLWNIPLLVPSPGARWGLPSGP